MGKEENGDKDVEPKQEGKKIIRKFPFKEVKSKTSHEDQELK